MLQRKDIYGWAWEAESFNYNLLLGNVTLEATILHAHDQRHKLLKRPILSKLLQSSLYFHWHFSTSKTAHHNGKDRVHLRFKGVYVIVDICKTSLKLCTLPILETGDVVQHYHHKSFGLVITWLLGCQVYQIIQSIYFVVKDWIVVLVSSEIVDYLSNCLCL